MRHSHDPSLPKAGLTFRAEPIGFAGAGWHCDELLQATSRAEDFCLDAFTAVHMQTFSPGRTTYFGDAGYCASPLVRRGHRDHAGVMKWMQRWPFRDFAEKKWFATADAVDVPDYAQRPSGL